MNNQNDSNFEIIVSSLLFFTIMFFMIWRIRSDQDKIQAAKLPVDLNQIPQGFDYRQHSQKLKDVLDGWGTSGKCEAFRDAYLLSTDSMLALVANDYAVLTGESLLDSMSNEWNWGCSKIFNEDYGQKLFDRLNRIMV